MSSFKSTMEKLNARADEAKTSKQTRLALECEVIEDYDLDKCEEELLETAKSPAARKIGRKLVKAADEQLLRAEQLGLFTSLPVTERRSFPTLLARLPIFLPIPASKQKDLIDNEFAFNFETPFGRGRRFGPPATIEDEDVLFALLQLSERRLIGKSTTLPIPITNDVWLRDKDGHLTVQITIATISQICDALELTKCGNNYKSVFKSLKRLSHISIEIETRKQEMYLGTADIGETFKLVDVKWKAYEEEGLILAQFTPVMVKWLIEQRTFLNWDIRKKLKSANAKAVHRFLSTQGNHYKAELDYIANVISWHGDRRRLKTRMEVILEQLRDELDWCDFKIYGTGRAEPFVLEFWRRKT